MPQPLELLTLARYTTPPSRCAYLPTQRARLEYRVLMDVTATQHDALLSRGWRRFGCEWFRPVCPACTACRSLRIPLATFTPSRSQRRALRWNATMEVVVQPPTITHAHIRLYNAYHAALHWWKGWPWHTTDPVAYFQSYIGGDWAFAREFLYYNQGRLVGVALADITPAALSSVYFFHDPAWRPRAPGVFAILPQLAYGQRHGLRYHSLGYWIAACPSMAYKAQYRPHELLVQYPPDEVKPQWVPG